MPLALLQGESNPAQVSYCYEWSILFFVFLFFNLSSFAVGHLSWIALPPCMKELNALTIEIIFMQISRLQNMFFYIVLKFKGVFRRYTLCMKPFFKNVKNYFILLIEF